MTRNYRLAFVIAVLVTAAVLPAAHAQTLTRITVTPTTASLAKGKTVQLQAYGWFSNGTRQLLTSKAAWSSSDDSVATVQSAAGTGGALIGTAGKVNAISMGVATVTATYTQPGGPTVSGIATITVTPPTLTSMVLTLTPSTIPVSGISIFTATGTFSDGTSGDVTNNVVWSTSQTTIVKVTNATDSGQGLAGGSATIRGAVGAVIATKILTVTPAPTTKKLVVTNGGGGTVVSSPTGISCGATCTKDFTGTVTTVTLTSTPATGNQFGSWTGCTPVVGVPNKCTVTLGAVGTTTNVSAVFKSKINVLRYGGGGGTVTSDIAGISCGSDCSDFYHYGTSVQLTASEDFAGTGGTFDGWSGCDSVTGKLCTVKAAGTRQPQVIFDEQLDVVVEGTGGTVVSNIAGINCDATESIAGGCSEEYHYSTAVNLTITPPTGSHVSATGCDFLSALSNGNSVCTVTMNAPRAVNVRFVYYLDVTLTNGGGGTLNDTATTNPTGEDGQIACNPDNGFNDCHGEYVSGTVVEVTATPNAGGLFADWTSGACLATPTDNPCLITMDADQTTNGRFTFTVSATIGHGFGSVLSTPTGVSCDESSDPCSAEFTYETTVDVTATAAPGSSFYDWTGCNSQPAAGTCRVFPAADTAITVRFNAPPVATDQSVSVDADSSGNPITLGYTDADGDSVTFNVPTLTTPEGGTVDETTPDNDASVTYSPFSGFSSPPDDSFDFTVSDGFGSDTGTVNVTVIEPDAPDVTAPADFDAYEGVQAFIVVQISGGDGSGYSLDVVSNEPAGTAVFNVLGNWIVRWTPAMGAGDFVMGLEASDGTTITPFTVNVDIHDLVSITVSPEPAFAELGKTRQFFVIGNYDDTAAFDVSDLAGWVSMDETIATIHATTGVATAVNYGATDMQGTVDGFTDSAALEVVDFDTRFAFTANDDGTISQWAVDSATGQLRPNGFIEAPLADRLVTSPAGNRLYAFNTSVSNVNIYDISADGKLTEASFSPWVNFGTSSPQALVMPQRFEKKGYISYAGTGSNGSAYLKASALGALQVEGGPGGGTSRDFISNHAETFLYLADLSADRVSTFSISSGTGSYSFANQAIVGANIKRLEVDALDRFLYIIFDDGAGTWSIKSYTIDSGTGAITFQSTYTPSNTPIRLVSGSNGNQLYLATDTNIEVINADGSGNLTLGGTVTTDCVPRTINMDVQGTYVYIGCDSAEIQRFSRDTSTGALTAIPKVAARGGINAIAFTAGAPLEFVPEFVYTAPLIGSNIRGYSIDSATGVLSAVPGSPYAEGTSSHGAMTSSLDDKFVYVDRASSANIHGYSIDATSGQLSDAGITITGDVAQMEPHPNSTLLYTAQKSNGVRVFSIGTTGALSLVQSFALPTTLSPNAPAVIGAGGVKVDALGRFVFVTGGDGQASPYNAIFVYSIDPTTGLLTYQSETAIPNAAAIALDPLGKFLYVNQNIFNPYKIYTYSIASNGTLANAGDLTVSNGTERIDVDPTGRYLFSANQNGVNVLSAYIIDQSTGLLTANGGSGGSDWASDLRVDFSGKFIHVVLNTFDSVVRSYPINGDGTVGSGTSVSEAPDDAGIALTSTGKFE
jgi:6-phosphogluconolactonase (cycloisomerase 2 family)